MYLAGQCKNVFAREYGRAFVRSKRSLAAAGGTNPVRAKVLPILVFIDHPECVTCEGDCNGSSFAVIKLLF